MPMVLSILAGLGFILFPYEAFAREAKVDTQQGSFVFTTQDHWNFAGNLELSLQRSYSSRSDYRGILGMGWCSELDWQLVQAKGASLLMKCDDVEVHMEKPRKTVLGLEIKGGSRTWIFAKEGRLSAIRANQKVWLIHRDLKGLPVLIEVGHGQLLTLTYRNFSSSLEQAESTFTHLKYRNEKNLLLSVVSKTKPLRSLSNFKSVDVEDFDLRLAAPERSKLNLEETYLYNSFGNLTQIQDAKKITEVRYEDLKDLALSLSDEGCLRVYSYKSREFTNRVEDEVEIQSNCAGKAIQLQHQYFSYQKTSGNQVRLERQANKGDE